MRVVYVINNSYKTNKKNEENERNISDRTPAVLVTQLYYFKREKRKQNKNKTSPSDNLLCTRNI